MRTVRSFNLLASLLFVAFGCGGTAGEEVKEPTTPPPVVSNDPPGPPTCAFSHKPLPDCMNQVNILEHLPWKFVTSSMQTALPSISLTDNRTYTYCSVKNISDPSTRTNSVLLESWVVQGPKIYGAQGPDGNPTLIRSSACDVNTGNKDYSLNAPAFMYQAKDGVLQMWALSNQSSFRVLYWDVDVTVSVQ